MYKRREGGKERRLDVWAVLPIDRINRYGRLGKAVTRVGQRMWATGSKKGGDSC